MFFTEDRDSTSSPSTMVRVKRFVARGCIVSPNSIPMNASPCTMRQATRKKEVKCSKQTENRLFQPDCDCELHEQTSNALATVAINDVDDGQGNRCTPQHDSKRNESVISVAQSGC